MHLFRFSILVCLGAAPSFGTAAEPSAAAALPPVMTLVDVRQISAAAPHSAFTSLIRTADKGWFCAFREGSAHVPGTDGEIRILNSADGETWATAALLREKDTDLRDPQLCVLRDGRLLLSAGGSVYAGESAPGAKGALTGRRTRVATSADGRAWSAFQPVCQEGDWLWRITPRGDDLWGMSYTGETGGFRVSLWKAEGGGFDFTKVSEPDPGKDCQPNETTLRFLPDGTLTALVRNENKGGHSYFGSGGKDGKTWTWTDTGSVIQGPDFIRLKSGAMVYAGRDTATGAARTVVGRLSPEGKAWPLLTLPSGGDTSYPGLVEAADGVLWISYYSSHGGSAAIYLARVGLTGF